MVPPGFLSGRQKHKTVGKPVLDSVSWSRRDFWQDVKNTKTQGAFLDSVSWSRRDFWQDDKNTKTQGAFLDSVRWSRRDFCQDDKNKKTCTKQVLMGEISIMRANNLARSDFTPVALQQAGGRGRITAGYASCPAGRASRARSATPTRRT